MKNKFYKHPKHTIFFSKPFFLIDINDSGLVTMRHMKAIRSHFRLKIFVMSCDKIGQIE